MSNPWYAFYPGDYGRDTAHLSMIEDSAYRRLLDHYYSTGHPIPTNVQRVFRICRTSSATEEEGVRSVLAEFFTQEADGWHNQRVDQELAKSRDINEKRSRAGKESARQRGLANATSEPTSVKQVSTQPQPQPPTQTQSNSLARSPLAEAEEIYGCYPRKIGRKAALKAIEHAIKRVQEGEYGQSYSRDEAVAGIKKRTLLFAGSPAGNRGVFTPHAATWFNRSSYLDDPEEWERSDPGQAKSRSIRTRENILAGLGLGTPAGGSC